MSPPREDFVWACDVDAASLHNPQADLCATIDGGKLTVAIKGAKHQEVDLPDDAFTDDASAAVHGQRLTVTIPRRDPLGPAMQEKALFNPDRRPISLAISLPKELLAKAAAAKQQASPQDQPGGMTPAELTLTEGNPGLSRAPQHAEGAPQPLSSGELADKLKDTLGREAEPQGEGTVLHSKPGPVAADTPAGGDATADAPAGVPVVERVRGNNFINKVGMDTEVLTPGDYYVTSESRDHEPISSVKQPGPGKCDLCDCNPCQCGKMRKTGGTGNDPFELTPAETKRGGRPAIHAPHKQETGVNSHEARDYRGHAGQANAAHVGIGGKLADFKGNVPEGVGDWSDSKYAGATGRPQGKGFKGSTHTGGAPIAMGGSGASQASDAAKGGQKTTFTTLG